MDKQKALDSIAKEIKGCKICKKGKIGKAVIGEGSAEAKVMFIGEAPGKNEAATGRPFVGRSGKLLRESIKAIGFKEEDVYITSPVKYLPKRGTPSQNDIIHGRKHLREQINIIKPKILVLLGNTASFGVLGKQYQITKEHGKTLNENGMKYFLSFHPAAAIRFPNKYKKIFLSDFKKIKKLVGT